MRDGERMAEVRKLNAEPAVLAAIKEGLTALREELTLPQREDQGT